MSEGTPAAPAGWYPQGEQLRYWDGTAWTEHTAPVPQLQAPMVVPSGNTKAHKEAHRQAVAEARAHDDAIKSEQRAHQDAEKAAKRAEDDAAKAAKREKDGSARAAKHEEDEAAKAAKRVEGDAARAWTTSGRPAPTENPAAAGRTPAAAPDVYDQLRKLEESHGAGFLTDEEFAAKRQRLLDQLR